MGRAGVRDPRGDSLLERRDHARVARRGGASGPDARRGETGWYALGRWTFDDDAFERTSVLGQEDAFGSVGPGELDGFLLPQGEAGHLVVIVGFTDRGDPIVNDPAAPSNDAVRRSYDRAQFERVWLEGSGGAVYVITPPGTALPPSPGNW